jgi:hypothetical protein
MTGLESIATDAAIKGVATIIASTAGKGGIDLVGKTVGWFWNKSGELTQEGWSFFRPIAKKYIENYTKRHGIVKVLGMREPVSLDSIYTNVQFLDDRTIVDFESIEALEKAFRENPRRSFEWGERQKHSGIDVANYKQYLMVLGGPGMGKTTFLRKVGLEALKGKRKEGYHHTCIPVFLELKQFRSGEINLEAAIAYEFQQCDLPKYQECTSKLLEQGKLLILFDGLDELPTERLSEVRVAIEKSKAFNCLSRERVRSLGSLAPDTLLNLNRNVSIIFGTGE